MVRGALFFVFVYAVFNLGGLYSAITDPVEREKLTELNNCRAELFLSGTNKKICNSTADFDKKSKEYQMYLSTKLKNQTIHENKELNRIRNEALNFTELKHVRENESCQNRTAWRECKKGKTPVFSKDPEENLKHKLYNKKREMVVTRSSCITSKQLYACIFKNVLARCDDIVVSYFKKIEGLILRNCTEFNSTGSGPVQVAGTSTTVAIASGVGVLLIIGVVIGLIIYYKKRQG